MFIPKAMHAMHNEMSMQSLISVIFKEGDDDGRERVTEEEERVSI